MRTRRGYTLVEALVCTAILLLTVALTLPSLGICDRGGRLTGCAMNLTVIYKSMYQWSDDHDNRFPVAGRDGSADLAAGVIPGAAAGYVVGFREGDRATGRGAILESNLTASLWLVVRSGAVEPKAFVCPSTTDVADPLTRADGKPAELKNTHDFAARRNLSYSTINMYHRALAKQWSTNAPSDFVLMSDNNANDFAGQPGRHTLSKGAAAADVVRAETSPNHRGDGENFLYGDGHVAFSSDPFVGRDGDNAFAMRIAGRNAPPTLGNGDGDAAGDADLAAVDSWMIPLSGNGGGAGSLSGLRGDVVSAPPPREPWNVPLLVVWGLLLLLPVPLGAWAVVFGLSYWRRRSGAAEAINEPRP